MEARRVQTGLNRCDFIVSAIRKLGRGCLIRDHSHQRGPEAAPLVHLTRGHTWTLAKKRGNSKPNAKGF